MALFTPSAVISEIRGSVGTAVFSRNAYRNIVRNRVTPMDPNTTYQQDNRANMATAVAAWQALSPAVQTKFETAAKNYNTHAGIDNRKALNGYNFYLKTRLTALQFGLSAPSGVFVPRKLPTFNQYTVSVFDVSWELSFFSAPPLTGFQAWFKFTFAMSPGIRSCNNSALVYAGQSILDGEFNYFDLGSFWEVRFGDTLDQYDGQAVFTEIGIVDTVNCIAYPGVRFRSIING